MLQKAAHARCRLQAERAASGQHHGVNAVGDVLRPQHIHFFGAGGGAADVHAAHGPAITQNYGAAGECVIVRHMPHADSCNVRKSFHNLVVW